jgi:NAD(P)-dependent dehydrogenase (short-subunit alcohol dehydrogenase family)
MNASLKVAVVTGAGTGIGKASALALAQAGYQVAFAGRRREILDKALAEAGGNGIAVATDVTDPGSVKALFAAIEAKWGRVDVLFNNAGGGAPAVPMDELPWEKWKAVVDANLNGSFLCAQAAMALMKRQSPRGGRIINNGSISAHAPRPNTAAYTSTKHAITGLTKASNLDGRKYDIAVGQVDIGNAATPMTDRMVAGPGVMQPDGTMKQEPRMDAKAVGDAVAYMAGLPLDANVLFMTVMASKMPFVGRG